MKEDELQELLEKANSSLQKGNKDQAISLYEEIVLSDPENALAHMRLAELYAEKGLKEKALDELLLLGNAYYESRLFKNALKYFLKVLELDPVQIDTRIKVADIYNNDELESKAKLEYLAIAEYFLSANNLKKAKEYAKKAIELKSLEALYVLGRIQYTQGMFKEAAVSLETLTKIKINHVAALLCLGCSYVGDSKYYEAVVVFKKVLRLEHENIEALKGLTDAYAGKGSSVEAIGYYLKGIDLMTKTKDFDGAIKISLKFIKSYPAEAEGYAKLAEVYEAKGMKKEAGDYYKLAGNYYQKQKAAAKAEYYNEKAEFLGKNIPASAPVPRLKERRKTVETGGGRRKNTRRKS
jgi:tetratricopeptide (TPR) repeat protein